MIEVEHPNGTIVEFPDGTSREVMSAAMRKLDAPSAPQQPTATPAQPERGALEQASRYTQQAVGPALAGVISAPGLLADIPLAAVKGAMWLGDKALGTESNKMLPLLPTTSAISRVVKNHLQVPEAETYGERVLSGASEIAGGIASGNALGSLFSKAPRALSALSRVGLGSTEQATQAATRAAQLAELNRPVAAAFARGAPAASTVGTGVGASAAQEYAKEITDNPLLQMLAGFLGGATGGTAGVAAMGQGIGKSLPRAVVEDVFSTDGITSGARDDASVFMKEQVQRTQTIPEFNAQFRAGADRAKQAGLTPLSADQITNNTGVVQLGNMLRNDGLSAARFAENDRNALRDVENTVGRLADEKATPDTAFSVLDQNRASAVAKSEADMAALEASKAAAEQRRSAYDETVRNSLFTDQTQSDARALATPGQQADMPLGLESSSSQREISRTVRETAAKQEAERQSKYATAEKLAEKTGIYLVGSPFVRAAEEVHQGLSRLSPSVQGVSGVMNRLYDVLTTSKAGQNVRASSLIQLRNEMSKAIRAAGLEDGLLKKQLITLKDGINETLNTSLAGTPAGEALNAADAFFEDGIVGAGMRQYDGRTPLPAADRIALDANVGAPESQFVQRNVNSPEDLRDIETLISKAAHSELPKLRGQIRDWLVNSFKDSVASTGEISPKTINAWEAKNADYLAQSPEAREMISEIRKAVINNDGRISDLAQEITSKRASVAKHEAEFQDSVFSSILKRPPEEMADAIFSNVNPPVAMKQVMDQIGENPNARESLKRAVQMNLQRRVFNSKDIGEGDNMQRRSSAAKFQNLSAADKRAMGMLYGEEAMQSLEELSYQLQLMTRSGSVSGGSQTAGLQSDNERLMATLALGARSGAIGGGNALASAARWNNLMLFVRAITPGSKTRQANMVRRVLTTALLDPDAAKLLLERPVGTEEIRAWNSSLANRINASQNLRDDEEEDKGLVIDIPRGTAQ